MQRADAPGEHRVAHGDVAAAEHLGAHAAAHRFVGRVDVDDAERGIAQHHRVGGGVEDRAVLLLACAQRALGELGLGGVAAHVQHVRLAAVAHRHAAHLEHEARAVRARALGFEEDRPPGDRLAVQIGAARRDRGIARQRQVLQADDLLAPASARRLVGRVHIHDAELGVAQHQRVGRGVEDGAVLLLARAQRALGELALGDVAADVQHVRLAAVAHRHAAHLEHERRAVRALAVGFEVHRLAGERHGVELHALLRGVLGAHRERRLADHLAAALAAHRLVGGVDVDDAELGVAQHQRVGTRVEDGAVLLLAAAQRLLHGLARRNVAADVEHVRLAAVAHRHAVHLAVEQRAVLAHRLALDAHRLAPERAAVQLARELRVAKAEGGHPVGADDLLERVAGHAREGRVGVHDAEFGIAQVEAVGSGVEDRAVLLLAGTQCVHCLPLLGDVAPDVEHVRRAAVLHRHRQQLDEDGRAVRALALGHHALVRAREHAPVQLQVVRRRAEEAHGHVTPAQHVLALHADCRFVGGIDVDDAELGVAQHERVCGGVEDGAVLLLARAQRLVRDLAFGDFAARRQDVRLARKLHALQRELVPVQAAVLVAPMPLAAHHLAGARAPDVAPGVGGGEGRLARAQVRGGEAAQLLGAVPVHRAGLGVGVDDRPAVVVEHENAGFGAVEDRPVARRGAPPLDLGADARGEDLQHRLGDLGVPHRRARHHAERADRRAMRVVQGGGGVALDALFGEQAIARELLRRAGREEAEGAADRELAGRSCDRVLDVLRNPAAEVGGEGAQHRALRLHVHRDQRELDAEDARERTRQVVEHALALRRGDGKRRLAQGLGQVFWCLHGPAV